MNDLLVMTTIAGRRCALHARDVQSVIELGKITPVPQTADFISGITALRSQTLTVIDCRRALGLHPDGYPTDTRAAAINLGGHAYALVVDNIEDITSAVAEPTQILGGFGENWSRVATGMVETSNGPALLIDIETLIAGPEVSSHAA